MNKNIYKPFLALFLCFFLVGMSASVQAQSVKKVKKMLVKKWKIDVEQLKTAMEAKMKEEMKEQMKEQEEEGAKEKMLEQMGQMMQSMLSMMENVRLEFKKDGQLFMSMSEEREEGQWELSEDAKTLYFVKKNGNKDEQIIKSISKKLLVLDIDDDTLDILHLIPAND